MTDQPQPAALSEAKLVRDVQATLNDLATYSETLTAPGLIDALAYHGVRLVRADALRVTVDPDAPIPYEQMDVCDQTNYRNLRTWGVSHERALHMANAWIRMRSARMSASVAAERDVSADDAIAVAVINWLLNGKKGRPSQAVRSALTEAGLVIVDRGDLEHARYAVKERMSVYPQHWDVVLRNIDAALAARQPEAQR